MNLIYVHTHDSGRYMQPYGIGTDLSLIHI